MIKTTLIPKKGSLRLHNDYMDGFPRGKSNLIDRTFILVSSGEVFQTDSDGRIAWCNKDQWQLIHDHDYDVLFIDDFDIEEEDIGE